MLHDRHIHCKYNRMSLYLKIICYLLYVVYIHALYMMSYFNFRRIYTKYIYFYSTVYRKWFSIVHDEWKYLVMQECTNNYFQKELLIPSYFQQLTQHTSHGSEFCSLIRTMGLYFHFPQQNNSVPYSESRVKLWFDYNSYPQGGVCIFYSSIVLNSERCKSEEQNYTAISCNNDNY